MTIQPDLFSPNAVHIQDVETEGVKYAGSKLKLIPHILSLVAGCGNVRSVLDGFSGTTRVSQAFAKSGYDTTANDISVWSETFARCYLERGKDDAFYQSVLDELNRLPGTHGWFTETYGTDGSKSPFQTKNLMRLDAMVAIRDLLERTDAQFILLSYSSGGRATREELMDAISENGTLEKAVSVDYKRNVMANMRWTNEWTKDTDKNQEYLFLLRKRSTSGRIPAGPLNLAGWTPPTASKPREAHARVSRARS